MTSRQECILVIDDVEENRAALRAMLAGAGYEVVLAGDGHEALELLEREKVDLILLDVMMPGIDGFEVLRRVRRTYQASELPVIMLTSRDETDDVITALRLGANDYCVKPAEYVILLKRVERHLALTRGKDRVIGGYRILRKLGAGGMGIVYEAEPEQGGSRVALKVLPRSLTTDERFVARFGRECQLAARVRHPSLVGVLDAGKDDETYFMAMELVQGTTLTERVDREALPVDEALQVVRQLARGLAALADVGILHRDIKPDNILLAEDGTARLTDFGIARELGGDSRLTTLGVGLGFAPYVSPEQMMGDGDHRSDIYSLGATLYYMLSGVDPYPEGEAASRVLSRKMERPPDVRQVAPHVGHQLARLVSRMMDPRPAQRPASFEALDAELSRAAESSVVWPLLPPWLVGLALALSAALAGLFWWWLGAG